MNGYAIVEVILSLCVIYLTFSLLTSILVEIVDSIVNLRARNLRKTIARMLQDENSPKSVDFYIELISSRSREKDFVKRFYRHPRIKYLGKNWLYASPSNIPADTFSKTMIDLLSGKEGLSNMNTIGQTLGFYDEFDKSVEIDEEKWEEFVEAFGRATTNEAKEALIDEWVAQFSGISGRNTVETTNMAVVQMLEKVDEASSADDKFQRISSWYEDIHPDLEIDGETRKMLLAVYRNSSDLAQFKTNLEAWFNDMMDISVDWYKKWTARIAFIIGLGLAILFNIDSVYIGEGLAQDEDLASEISQNATEKQGALDPKNDKTYDTRVVEDGSGKHIENNVGASKNTFNRLMPKDRINYKTCPYWALLGWVITALAISFGAPFWFDLLNKFIRFRGTMGSRPKDDHDGAVSAGVGVKSPPKATGGN